MPERPAALTLAADVFAAQVGDDLVLLDLVRGRYLCLSEVVLGPARGVTGSSALLEELAQAGLASAAPAPGGLVPRPVATPRRSVACGPVRPRDLESAGLAVRDAACGYLGRPLAALVAAAARGRRAPEPAASATVLATASAFQAYAPYLPLTAKCLLRSFLLLARLRAAGEDAVWVFGVRTWPFAAHCWLQAEDVVLDDHWERVAGHVPILAV